MDRLVFVEGAQKGQRFPLDKATLTMGRDRKSDIPVDDPGCSRNHATLFRTGSGLRLRDQGSTNGTYVNSRRIREVDLQNGDRISIGDAVMLVETMATAAQPRVLVSDAEHDTSTDITMHVDSTTLFTVSDKADECAGFAEMTQAIFRFSTSIAGVLDQEKLLPLAAQQMAELLGADRGALLFLDKADNLTPMAIWPEGSEDMVISRTITEYVLEQRKGVLSNPGSRDDSLRKGISIAQRNVGSILCVPLMAEDRVLGAGYFDTRLTTPPFRESGLRLLSALSVELALAIENASLYRSLRNAEEFGSCILKSISAGLVVTDMRGVVIRANDAAAEIFGLEQRDFVGLPVASATILGELAEMIQQTQETGLPMERAEANVLVRDRSVPLGISTSLLEDYTGKTTGVVCSFRDLTRMKKLEEEVKRSKHLASLGEMAAGIAHEVRNPLNSVRGFAQLLGENAEKRGDASDIEYAGIVIEEVDRINRIVQDLLDFSRQRDLTMQALSLPDLVHSVGANLRAEFLKARVRCKVEVATESHCIMMGSGDKLRQLFVNLFRNALQACEPEGCVSVILETGQDETRVFPVARVRIRDDGCGIRQEDREKIFDPFFTTKDVGTGLGLSLCQKIVEQHAGRIEVESEPGLGSTFTVTLPIREE